MIKARRLSPELSPRPRLVSDSHFSGWKSVTDRRILGLGFAYRSDDKSTLLDLFQNYRGVGSIPCDLYCSSCFHQLVIRVGLIRLPDSPPIFPLGSRPNRKFQSRQRSLHSAYPISRGKQNS